MADKGRDSDEARGCPYPKSLRDKHLTTESPHQHPLITFKRFIDDHFTAIASLPSLMDFKERVKMAGEERKWQDIESQARWTGHYQTSDHVDLEIRGLSSEEKHAAFDAAMMLVKESEVRNRNVSPAKIEALYADHEWMALEHDRFAAPMLSFGGACYYMPETGDNLPSTASLFGRWPKPSPRWLSIDWFKRSIYSPIQLEEQDESPRWRQAFEDLLLAALEKPMTPLDWSACAGNGMRPNQLVMQDYKRGPGLDWMLSLQCRGVLPPQIPSIYRSARRNTGVGALNYLESVRTRWQDLADSWGPSTPETDFASLVKEVATPAGPGIDEKDPVGIESLIAYMPDSRTIATAEQIGQAFSAVQSSISEPELQSPPSKPGPDWLTTDAAQQLMRVRRYGSDFISREAKSFWRCLAAEDTDGAAAELRDWERRGYGASQLIEDDDIVFDYLRTNTEPVLWPLCEALEKADSHLYRLRSANHERTVHEDATTSSSPVAAATGILKQAVVPRPVEAVQTEDVPPSSGIEKGVLAALTTTQITHHPDGTVTTKTVLKKRFVDGTESTTESTRIEHPDVRKEEAGDTSTKKGWFWS